MSTLTNTESTIKLSNGSFVKVGDYSLYLKATAEGVNEWECGLSYVPKILTVDKYKRICHGDITQNRTFRSVHQRRPFGSALNHNVSLREDAPWTVSLTTSDNQNCSGVLITFKWVLTHPKCLNLSGNPSLTVTAGIYKQWTRHLSPEQLNRGRYQSQFYQANVETGDFSNEFREYGFTLLKLPEPFKRESEDALFYDLNTICLPEARDPNQNRETALFTGWGRDFSDELPKQMKIIQVHLERYNDCNFIVRPGLAKPEMLCSGHENNEPYPCNGDWGGPLFQYDDRKGSRGILIGIFDYRPHAGCAPMASIDDWVQTLTNVPIILQKIEENS